MTHKKILEILQEKKLSLTEQRIKILECLIDDVHFHTVADILEHIGENNINTKTIYNNMKTLIKEDVVEVYSFKGVSKYAINDSLLFKKPVIHIVNDSLDSVEHQEIQASVLEEIKSKVNIKDGREISDIRIYIHTKSK